MVKRVGVLCVVVVLVFVLSGGSAGASFGLQSFTTGFFNQDGSPDVQAGSHPWAMVTTLNVNTMTNVRGVTAPDGDMKDLQDELPVGFVGDPTATPKCTAEQFSTERPVISLSTAEPESCPVSTQVGRVELELLGPSITAAGVYNLVPPPGVPAEFGFTVLGLKVLLTPSVRTGGDYGLTVTAKNISQAQGVLKTTITLWGVPADASHDNSRIPDLECERATKLSGVRECEARIPPKPFLTMPSACSGGFPLTTAIHFDSWQEPGNFLTTYAPTLDDGSPVGLAGCGALDFSPTVSVTPDTSAADSPAGLAVDVHLPQNSGVNGFAEADLKKAVVALPAGMTVSPSAANGRLGCTPEEIGMENAERVSCPDASKVGSVEVETPLLEDHLLGSVYLAAPENNKFHSLLALYIVAEANGVLIKLAGKVEADPVTGQLTTTFDENPQLPFSDLKLNFFGGPRAALVTPLNCGAYETNAELSPWSGTPPVHLSSSFNVTSACGGGFFPTFTAGTTNTLGGGFSPFSATFSRADTDQYLEGLSVKMPPGLLGTLAKVPLCGGPQAQQGTCPSASAIGTTTVSAGPGIDSVSLPVPGQPPNEVYLTGPYKGAPFGLSIVVPAIAGPFNLGTVVERATINVDPRTAQITITSDPLPTILRGIPLQVRSINVTVDRPGFTFNPTSCAPMKINATITSTQGTNAALTSPYGAIECARMPFKPKLTASTEGKASANNGGDGASLTVAVTSKGGPGVKGEEANIKKVDVQLPKGLSARLRTLQRACTEQQFVKNPAGCPKESNVGTATAITPVLPVPLKGFAYLVSHGGKAFPELIVVLQGDGVTLDLNGETLIKKAITYSHFETVPDAPISSFKLTLPERKFSALASPAGNLCNKTLRMPTTIEGQNGAVITQNTKLSVTGCHKKAAKKTPKTTHK
jgi:hypothetical protein